MKLLLGVEIWVCKLHRETKKLVDLFSKIDATHADTRNVNKIVYNFILFLNLICLNKNWLYQTY